MSHAVEANESAPPTRVRYLVVFVTFLAAFLLYLHRFCMTYAQRYIKEDLRLTEDEFGYCLSAFFFAYALMQVPSGWLSDRFGARIMLTIYILVWSFFTGMMGMTTGFAMLIVVRMAAGIGQAGAYPTSAALLSRWATFQTRGTASGIVAFGGRLGGGLAPILTVAAVIAFVPSSEPSVITTDDLLDPYYLGYRMFLEHDTDVNEIETAPKSVDDIQQDIVKDVGELTSEKTASVGVQLGETYAQAADESLLAKNRYDPNAQRELGSISKADASALVTDLNRLLDDRELSKRANFVQLPLEREARQLLSQSTPLTALQSERLNRLLLEAAFPNSIRKIYVQGWRPVMFLYGSLGLIVAMIFWLCFRDWPNEHPRCNAAEIELIARDKPTLTKEASRKGGVPIGPILKSGSLWLMCLNQWCSNVGWVFLVTWLPRYLFEVHSVPLVQRGLLCAIPLWVGWSGMLLGGYVTDRVTAHLGLRWRTLPIVAGRFLAMFAYLGCLLEPSVWIVTALFAVVAFSNDFCNPSSWAYKQDVGGKDVGSVHGWANMWGNLGATVSPVLLQLVISNYSWNWAFLTCSTAFLISGLAACGVDARVPIVREEAES